MGLEVGGTLQSLQSKWVISYIACSLYWAGGGEILVWETYEPGLQPLGSWGLVTQGYALGWDEGAPLALQFVGRACASWVWGRSILPKL
jgi:hypothetical protein